MANDTLPEETEIPIEAIVERVTDTLFSGGTLGSLIGYDQRDYEAMYTLGHSHYAQGRYADAMKAFSFLVTYNPMERRYVNAFASCLQMEKRYDEAISFYSLTSVMDMTDPRPTFHTAECMIALGRKKEAKDALGIVIEQCKKPEQEALKSRAQALLDLLSCGKPNSGPKGQ